MSKKKKKRILMTRTGFNVICENGHTVVSDYDIGEYPYSWQFMRCNKCGFAATPDLDNPIETHTYAYEKD